MTDLLLKERKILSVGNTMVISEIQNNELEDMLNWYFAVRRKKSYQLYRYVKRMADIVCATVGLVILAFPMLFVAFLIYLDDPGPIFFTQYRVGQGGKHFKIYKFRSMKLHTPQYMATSEIDDPNSYITRVGKVIRKLSIDELPQLFNVMFGDMSLVGPRPLIENEKEQEIHRLRNAYGVYALRPGLTGLAQIKGRDTVSPKDKVNWDVQYLKNYGLLMDMKILLITVPKVFKGSDIVEGSDFSQKL